MRKVIFILLIATVWSADAQQYPETQLYMVNPYLINPGFTGYLTDLSIFASATSPLVLDNNVIRNYQVGINKSIEKSYIGVGGKMVYDQRDFLESVYLDASFSYRVVTANKHVLSIGSNIGLVNRTFDVGKLSPYVDMRDPTLSSDYYYKTNLNLGLGIAYYSARVEAGLALPSIVEGSEQFTGYFNAFLAYKIYFANDEWVAKPNSYFVNYPDGTSQFHGNLMIGKSGVFWGQIGGSNTKSLIFSTGWTFNDNYELVMSHLQQLASNLVYQNKSDIMLRVHLGNSSRKISHIVHKRNRR